MKAKSLNIKKYQIMLLNNRSSVTVPLYRSRI